MPISNYRVPDIYIEEVPGGARPIQAVGTSTPGFIGVAPIAAAFVNEVRAIDNWLQFVNDFATLPPDSTETLQSTDLSNAVYGFFQNGGGRCYVVNVGAGGALAGGGPG